MSSTPDDRLTTPGPAAAEPAQSPARPGLDERGRVRRTRAGGLWAGFISAAVLALVFLVFIAQNSEKVTIDFLGLEGRLSLALALLLSAVTGALVVAVPGVVRIVQLRHALRQQAR